MSFCIWAGGRNTVLSRSSSCRVDLRRTRSGEMKKCLSPSCTCFNLDASESWHLPTGYPFLPPMKAEHEGRMTLVLDLDETLVYASADPLPAYHYNVEVAYKNTSTLYVVKRPGVDEFLAHAASRFEVVVFTASVKPYADAVIGALDPLGHISHRIYQDSCRTIDRRIMVKDLSLLGGDLSKVIIVDNNPQSYMLQPANAVPISSFRGNMQDCKLMENVLLRLNTLAKAGTIGDC